MWMLQGRRRPEINFIEVIREDTPEKLKPYEEICILTHGEAKKYRGLSAMACRGRRKGLAVL